MGRLMRHLRRQSIGPLPDILRAEEMELYAGGESFFAALFAALDRAERLICLEYYRISADHTGGRLAERLAAAVARGVMVLLIYDMVGCRDTPASFFSALGRLGVRCLPFNRFSLRRGIRWLDRRDHRKLAIIDGRQAFLGGLNIADAYAGRLDPPHTFHDVGFSLQGSAVVPLLTLFIENWTMEQGLPPHLPPLEPVRRPAPGDARVTLISGGPHQRRSAIRAAFRVAMAAAATELLIANPYFVPGPRIIRSLLRASRRGVKIRLLLPARSDVPLVRLVSRSSYQPLLEAGVEIFELERQLLHAKLMLIDGKRTVLGSANLDQRSFHRNFEINAIILSRRFGAQVKSLFERDLAGSRRITLDDHAKRGLLSRFLEPLLRPISWFL